ncbi:hypothetical protein OWR29_25425 [Actinoplanes sp. Pm04-4]|uniref:Uncharacterized protein n=1 Tax=Paractinoplanes pyxinae TaxID=2997416 RepID=A0ABT4B4B5_9ACTN|nr:hypothetical protein [Actinoplanes pyxinae]MCY1141353.1 hypothetical protein [Actinoplanes pyxinae]
MSLTPARVPLVHTGPKATQQAKPHKYEPDVTTPGTCTSCHLVKGHRLHDEAAIREHLAQLDEAQAEQRRRIGEAD